MKSILLITLLCAGMAHAADFSDCEKLFETAQKQTKIETRVEMIMEAVKCAALKLKHENEELRRQVEEWKELAQPILELTNVLIAATNTIWAKPDMVCGKIHWECNTNWTGNVMDSTTLMWPASANTVTHYETGLVQSNLVALIEWKGQIHGVTLETVYLQTLTRSYVIEEKKVYR